MAPKSFFKFRNFSFFWKFDKLMPFQYTNERVYSNSNQGHDTEPNGNKEQKRKEKKRFFVEKERRSEKDF